MDFTKVLQKRYSVRAYKPDPVEEEKVRQVLEAACLAPTAVNKQPFQIIVIRTADRKADLKRIYYQDWFAQAPLVIGICGIPAQSWTSQDGKNYAEIDVTITMTYLILAATNLGLGTCWIGSFDAAAAREVLGLPDGVEPMAFTPLGYPADRPGPRERKPVSQLVRYEHW